MTTFAFIHGAGDVGWYWHLVQAELERRGHATVAPDLPIDDDDAGLEQYAGVILDGLPAGGEPIVVVAQSFGGYVAPIVAAGAPDVRLLVLVAGMIPGPGESADEMFSATGWRPGPDAGGSELETFYHDVPSDLAREAMAHGRRQSSTPGSEPWPLERWPDVPVRLWDPLESTCRHASLSIL